MVLSEKEAISESKIFECERKIKDNNNMMYSAINRSCTRTCEALKNGTISLEKGKDYFIDSRGSHVKIYESIDDMDECIFNETLDETTGLLVFCAEIHISYDFASDALRKAVKRSNNLRDERISLKNGWLVYNCE